MEKNLNIIYLLRNKLEETVHEGKALESQKEQLSSQLNEFKQGPHA